MKDYTKDPSVPLPLAALLNDVQRAVAPGNQLGRLCQAIIENTQGDAFWLGEILLAEIEKETGYRHQP